MTNIEMHRKIFDLYGSLRRLEKRRSFIYNNCMRFKNAQKLIDAIDKRIEIVINDMLDLENSIYYREIKE